VSLFNGDVASSLGWFSPAYGVRVPACAARITHALTTPSILLSWCGSVTPGDVPTLERVACDRVRQALPSQFASVAAQPDGSQFCVLAMA
jgi:hypothetical protein